MNFKERYNSEIKKELQTSLGLPNPMSVPRLSKIVLNIGIKEAIADQKVLSVVAEQLSAISGQKPIVNLAKKSIAAFKLRQNDPIGISVTLRGEKMYQFLEKLIRIVFPRVRDFRGIPAKSFDGHGNLTIGFKEQIVFPEIDYSKIDRIRGLEVTIATNAPDDKSALALLKAFGFPFSKNSQNS